MSNSKRVLSLGFFLVIASATGSCAHIAGKTVAAKDFPNILVASDGSICQVSEDRFAKTEVGMKALCAWHGGGKIPELRLTPLIRPSYWDLRLRPFSLHGVLLAHSH